MEPIKNQFNAGAARVDITPPLGTLINGDFISHYVHTIHDPLYSKALVMEDDSITIVLVVVDICVMGKELIDDVKATIQEQTGINPENILISSTHAHSTGSVESVLLCAADLPYRRRLSGLILQSVLQAKQNMKPAKIAFGSIDVPEHVVCRRYDMKPGYKAYNPVTNSVDKIKTNPMGDEDKIERRRGVPDPAVGYLAVQDLNSKWISVLANYSTHYVGDWENGTVTADYFGVFARQLKSMLQATDDFVAMMSSGTSGDANIMDFIQPDRYPKAHFEKSELIGSDIADKVFRSVSKLKWEENPSLGSACELLEIPVRKPSAKELREAEELVAGTRYESLSLKESSESGSSHTGNEDNFRRIFAREQVLLNEYPDTIFFPVQALKIGSGVIGGLSAEIFSETGLWLKKNCQVKNYFTICLANGVFGYVPPEHEFEYGGYETWRCRTSFLNPKAEEIIRNKLLEIINGFFK